MELTEQIDHLTDPARIEQAVKNAAAHALLSQDEAALKLLRRTGVKLDPARPVQDIMLEAAQKNMRQQFDAMRASGKVLLPTRQYGAARVTASGAVYVEGPNTGKNGNHGPWKRVKGQAALDIKRWIKEHDAQ